MDHIAIIDIETTGIDVTEHEIIEIGAIVVTRDLSTIVAEYDALVHPTHPETASRGKQGSRQAFEVNGYEPAVWDAWGVDLDTALTGLAAVIEGCTPAGKQIDFDVAFLRQAYMAAERPWPAHAYRTLDVTGLCWPLHARGQVDSLSLDSLCAHFGLERPPVHRALADARAALEVARRMMALYPSVAAQQPEVVR